MLYCMFDMVKTGTKELFYCTMLVLGNYTWVCYLGFHSNLYLLYKGESSTFYEMILSQNTRKFIKFHGKQIVFS